MKATRRFVSENEEKVEANTKVLLEATFWLQACWRGPKGSFLSESLVQLKKWAKSQTWAENLDKLFTVMGEKFKFSAQDWE